MHIATFCAMCDMFNRQNWTCCLKGMLTLIYLDSLNSISKSPFKNFHFKLILGADCFLVLQGQPGKRGARGPMGEPGPKVHDSIIQITRFASTRNSLLSKWSPSSLVGFILNLFEMFLQITYQSTHKEPPFPGKLSGRILPPYWM